MSKVLNAMDEISVAQSLISLIEMATRGDTFGDRQDSGAISTACFMARDRLEAAKAQLEGRA